MAELPRQAIDLNDYFLVAQKSCKCRRSARRHAHKLLIKLLATQLIEGKTVDFKGYFMNAQITGSSRKLPDPTRQWG